MPTSPFNDPLYTEPMELGGFVTRPLDLLEHALVTGATGSGKTRSAMLPLTEAVLRRFGSDASSKAGLLLVDAKGDMTEHAKRCIANAGRSDDVLVLGPGGNCWFPLFATFEGDCARIAAFLHETLENEAGSSGGRNEAFWHENAKRFLRAAAVMAKARHGIELGGIAGMRDAITHIVSHRKDSAGDDEEAKPYSNVEETIGEVTDAYCAGRLVTNELQLLIEYLREDVRSLPSATWGCIANMSRNYVTHYASPTLESIFSESAAKKRITPEEVIDEGILLILCLSPAIFGSVASPFRLAVKKTFFQRLLQRPHLSKREHGSLRPINQDRPFLVVMDEFHTTLSPGRDNDAYFLDRARDFRCMCILATQGLSALSSVMPHEGTRNHLLNNCRTKFFFANDCPQTLEYFSSLGGSEMREVASVSYVRVPAPARFRLPGHKFVKPRRFAVKSVTVDTRRMPRFDSAELGSLPNGSALVVGKGRTLYHYEMDPRHYGNPAEGARE